MTEATTTMPKDSDYSGFDEPVTVWATAEELIAAPDLPPGLHVVHLRNGLHLDLLLDGQLDRVPQGQSVPVFFTGAIRRKRIPTGPFFSGRGIGPRLGSPFIAISDPTLNLTTDLPLGWYAGRAGDDLQATIAAILSNISERALSELLFIGGSGGGFASMAIGSLMTTPTSVVVWNPQIRLLHYWKPAVDDYLRVALSDPKAGELSRGAAERRLRQGRILHEVPSLVETQVRRLIYIQESTDLHHVAAHLGPYLDRTAATDDQRGRWTCGDGHIALLVPLVEGHLPPPRPFLQRLLELVVISETSMVEALDRLEGEGLLTVPAATRLPHDLRPQSVDLQSTGVLSAHRARDKSVHVNLEWQGSVAPGSAAWTQYHFFGSADSVTVSHRDPGPRRQLVNETVTHVEANVYDVFNHLVARFKTPITAPSPRRRVFIYGSCVSRDTAEFLDKERFEVASYVARQSVISAFGPPFHLDQHCALPESPFQRRMLTSDAASRMSQVLLATPDIDLVLWDLTDERMGVVAAPDGGLRTESVEWKALSTAPQDGTLIPFGTEEHFALFQQALPRWLDLLARRELLDRTCVIAPAWATRTTEGNATPASFGVRAPQASQRFARYHNLLAEAGLPILGTDLEPLADPAHQWGVAAFHYDKSTYEDLASQITDFLSPGRSGASRAIDRYTAPSVVVVTTGASGLHVNVDFPGLYSCAFHLFRGSRVLARTPHMRSASHCFPPQPAGQYRVRVFLRTQAGARVAQTSDVLTLPQ